MHIMLCLILSRPIKKFQKLDSSIWLYNQLQTFSTLIHTNLRYHKRIRSSKVKVVIGGKYINLNKITKI